ncbi:MAG: hypothetical protein KF878_01270 [Planctomycetes bacterium]|nr:hypothetical protein [Planctomycetota bacterium]
MSLDDELRRLERAAAQGDPEAAARLEELRRRAGRLIPVPLVIPPLGATVEEAEVGEVEVQVGAHVHKGQPLVVLETDKVSVELVAPADGVVTAVSAGAGERLRIGAEVVQLACADLPDDDPWALLAVARAAQASGHAELALRALDRAVPAASCGALYRERDAGVEGVARAALRGARAAGGAGRWRAALEAARGDEALRAEAAARLAALDAG